MPFCRDCGSSIDEDWVSCPSCGELIDSIEMNNEYKPYKMKKSRKTRESQNGLSLSTIISFVIAISMLLAIFYPSGIFGISLFDFAFADCSIDEADDYQFMSGYIPAQELAQLQEEAQEAELEFAKYCRWQQAKLVLCTVVLIMGLILSFALWNRDKEDPEYRAETERENRREKRNNRREKRIRAIKRFAIVANKRRNNPVLYYLKRVLMLSIIISLAIGIVTETYDERTTTKGEGKWVILVSSPGNWYGEIEVDGEVTPIEGNENDSEWNTGFSHQGEKVIVSVTNGDGVDTVELCVTLTGPITGSSTGPALTSNTQCTADHNGKVILPHQQSKMSWEIAAVLVSSPFILAMAFIELRYHLNSPRVVKPSTIDDGPPKSVEGEWQQGHEVLEWPEGSDNWWFRDENDGYWHPWE